jgi:hypothetical protein
MNASAEVFAPFMGENFSRYLSQNEARN